MKFSLLGLGIIGKAWSEHYRKKGWGFRAWNRTPLQILSFEKDLLKAADDVDALQIVVADPPAVRDILEKIKPKLSESTLVIQSSTIAPADAAEFEALVTSTGALYLEAPFTGSKVAAEEAKNVIYIGGSTEAKSRARPILEVVSQAIYDIGDVRQAAALKLAMNLQIASISQALTEALHLARSHGIADTLFFEAIEKNVAKSGLTDLKKPKLLSRDYSPQFSVKHMNKDLLLALRSLPPEQLPLTSATQQIYGRGIGEGLAEEDFIALEKLLSRPAGSQP